MNSLDFLVLFVVVQIVVTVTGRGKYPNYKYSMLGRESLFELARPL